MYYLSICITYPTHVIHIKELRATHWHESVFRDHFTSTYNAVTLQLFYGRELPSDAFGNDGWVPTYPFINT